MPSFFHAQIMLATISILPILIASFAANPLPKTEDLAFHKYTIEQKIEENSIFAVSNDEEIMLNVPYVHQINDLKEENKKYIRGTACGPAALNMALKFLNINKTLDEVIEKLPTTVYRKGDRFYDLAEGPKFFGKEAIEIESTPKKIYETLKSGKPVILNIQNYDGITGHAIVIIGIKGFDGVNAKSLIAHDPFVGPSREFKYVNQRVLKQPEGYINPIGTIKPFYVI